MRTALALAATLVAASCLASEPASTSERASRHLAFVEQELGTRFDRNIVTLSGSFSSQEEIGDVLVADGVDGWGECVAMNDPLYSSEYVDGAVDVLRRYLIPALAERGQFAATDVAAKILAVR